MPNYKSHISGGFLIFVLMSVLIVPRYHPSLFTMIEWLTCTMAGSLFPDIDTKSRGQRYFYILMILLIILFIASHRYTHLAVISTLSVVPLLVPHRGVFHRLWFVIIIPLIGWGVLVVYFPSLYTALFFDTIFFIAGAISHLWLDMGLHMFRC